jgi:uncharacterized protein involved in exopolysaccharide biosynthesis
MSLKDILAILFKRKGTILLFFFATVITAGIGAKYFQKPLYEAHVEILIETDRGYVSNLSLPTHTQRRTAAGLNLEQQIDLALQVLTGHLLARQVVDTIGPIVLYEELDRPSSSLQERLLRLLGRDDPVEKKEFPVSEIAALRLQGDIIALRTGRESSIIYVGLRHEDPAVAADVVNTLVGLYLEHHLQLRKKPELSRFFQEQFDNKKTQLEAAERGLQEFREKQGISSSLEDERLLILTQRANHQTQLDEVVSQEAELNNQIRKLRTQLANTAKDPQTIRTLHEKLVKLQLEESNLAIHYKDGSRAIQNLRKEVQVIRDKLAELGYNKRYGTAATASSLYGDLQADFLKSEVNLNALKARKATMLSQLEQYEDRLRNLNRLEGEFTHLQQELSMARENYRLYLAKFEEFRISNALDAEKIANIKVLEPAQAPLLPAPSKTSLILLLSVFFGSVGGIGLALFLELLGGTFNKKEDAEHYLQRPVLASIPELRLARKESSIGRAAS